MKRLVACLCLLLVSYTVAFADSSENLPSGKESAIANGQHMIQRHGYSADLLFNLGNACYRDNQKGLAVLYYRRALLLDSASRRDILQNLGKAQSDLGLTSQDIPAWRIRTGFFTLDTWTVIAFLAFTILSLNLFVRGLVVAFPYFSESDIARFKQWNFTCGCLAGLVALLSVSAAVIQNGATREAIVTRPDTPLLVSPFEQAETVNILREGEVVEISRAHGNYYLIELGPGRTGWADKASVVPVIPGKND